MPHAKLYDSLSSLAQLPCPAWIERSLRLARAPSKDLPVRPVGLSRVFYVVKAPENVSWKFTRLSRSFNCDMTFLGSACIVPPDTCLP